MFFLTSREIDIFGLYNLGRVNQLKIGNLEITVFFFYFLESLKVTLL